MKKKISKNDVKTFFAKMGETVKKRWWIALIELFVLAVVITLDLISKKYITEFLETQPALSYELIKGVLALTYAENTGAGFGILSDSTGFLIAISLIAVIALLIFLLFAQKQNEWLRISLVLIAGGGIGNLVDRVQLGYVRDFIEYTFLKNFAICNIADTFVTIGAVMLIIVLIVMLVKEGRKNKKAFEKEQAEKVATGETEELSDPLEAPINLNPMLNSPNDYKFASDEAKIADVENAEDNMTEEGVNSTENAQHVVENDVANGADGRSENS